MSDTRSHPECEQHHMAAARHVAAAYHHFQAMAAHDSCNHEQAQTHAATADAESTAAHKCSSWAFAEGSNSGSVTQLIDLQHSAINTEAFLIGGGIGFLPAGAFSCSRQWLAGPIQPQKAAQIGISVLSLRIAR